MKAEEITFVAGERRKKSNDQFFVARLETPHVVCVVADFELETSADFYMRTLKETRENAIFETVRAPWMMGDDYGRRKEDEK